MEIQDRNSLLQLLNVVKDGKPQYPTDETNVFADILKSAKNETSFPQNDTENIRLKHSAQTKSVDEDRFLNNKKETIKKTEVEDKEVSVAKKEEKKQVSKQDAKEDTAVKDTAVKDNSVNSKSEVVEEEQPAETTSNGDIENNVAVDSAPEVEDQANVVSAIMVGQIFDDMVLPEDTIVAEEIDVVEVKAQTLTDNEMLPVEEYTIVKQNADVKASQSVAEDFAVLSEEEKLLMEQAKYFDEAITTDKKLKIDVNVSEAKIAEPVVKDVLKNRFEIDSLFQTVDENIDVLPLEVENAVEEISIDTKPANTLSEAKNVLYNEVKITQDTTTATVSKDSTIVAVSGKEVVSELVNTSRNEAFTRINETISRDTFKGMSKEVIEQIKVNITKSAIKGVDTIDIQLKPEDLGKVQVKMHIAKDGKIQAEIIASRAETADLLQKDASSLSKAFNDAGYDTDAKSFTFSFQDEHQTNSQEKDDAGLLKFIGDTLEQEAEGLAGNDNLVYDPALGLNIRV